MVVSDGTKALRGGCVEAPENGCVASSIFSSFERPGVRTKGFPPAEKDICRRREGSVGREVGVARQVYEGGEVVVGGACCPATNTAKPMFVLLEAQHGRTWVLPTETVYVIGDYRTRSYFSRQRCQSNPHRRVW